MHRDTHSGIEQRGEPASVYDTQRVVMARVWLALEDRQAGLDVDRNEIQGLADRRARQTAGEDRVEYLHSTAARQFIRLRPPACRQPRTHPCFVFLPAGQRLLGAHIRSFSGLLVTTSIAGTIRSMD